MTEYRIKSTVQEADYIVKGLKRFIFRNSDNPIGFGDAFTIQPYNDGHMVRHAIDKMKFIVTYVSDDAPISKGFKVIGFDVKKEVRPCTNTQR